MTYAMLSIAAVLAPMFCVVLWQYRRSVLRKRENRWLDEHDVLDRLRKHLASPVENDTRADCRIAKRSFEGADEMTLDYAGRSHDEAMAARHKQKQKAQEQAGGEMAVEGTEADADHSCGELSERGKQVWRSGSGINGGGKE